MRKRRLWLGIVAAVVLGVVSGLFGLQWGIVGVSDIGQDIWADQVLPYGIIRLMGGVLGIAVVNGIAWLTLSAIMGVMVKLVTRKPWRTVMYRAYYAGLALAVLSAASVVTHTCSLLIHTLR